MKGGLNTYGYVGGNPNRWVDFNGLDYTVAANGNNMVVSMSITFYGPNATQYQIDKWMQYINNYWNNNSQHFNYGKCKVKFDITSQIDPTNNWWFTAKSADNYVYVGTKDYAGVWNHWNGYWGTPISVWSAAHEVGHFLGLKDDYTRKYIFFGDSTPNPNHEGHMMAESYGTVAQHEINEIIENSGVNSCGCSN